MIRHLLLLLFNLKVILRLLIFQC